MGAPAEIICETCRTVYYCGYGSYANRPARLALFPAHEHKEHVFYDHNSDSTTVTSGGHLADEDYLGEPEEDRIFLRDYAKFRKIDLSRE